jgi:hypothetical protein
MKGVPFNMTKLPEALAEFMAEGPFICFGQRQHTDAMRLELLRARRVRRQRHAGKTTNDLPPIHVTLVQLLGEDIR